MSSYTIKFRGKVILLGFGCIGQGCLPLIFTHLCMKPEDILIITADNSGDKVAEAYNVSVIHKTLSQTNYQEFLSTHIHKGDFLLNVSVQVESVSLIKFCQEVGALYLDTCIECWSGGYVDEKLSASERSNYALREQAIKLKGVNKPTAVITHGANPGIISSFAKQGMINMMRDLQADFDPSTLKTSGDWALLAQKLNIKVMHVAERDSQESINPKKIGEFVNTWSVDGFISEGSQPSELGWGSHEKYFPKDGSRHDFGRHSAIYLQRPGMNTRVLTWVPGFGQQCGFLVTHGESISISDYFTLTSEDGRTVLYRPTVHYSYHPCRDAVLSCHELVGRGMRPQKQFRILDANDIKPGGVDALGMLMMGNEKLGSYWFGSILSIDEAKQLVKYNSATSLQVTASCIAGMIWAILNPDRGVVEPEELDHNLILEVAKPYLGKLEGVYTDWHPLKERLFLFDEDLDKGDPWQFKNFRI
jgi:homospermidine synthase